jgi:hypothetical protein
MFVVVQSGIEGRIELHPILPNIVEGDMSKWEHEFNRQVTVYGQYFASFKVRVFRGVRTGGEDCDSHARILPFSFQDIGIFASAKGTVLYDAAIFYDANYFRSVSDISIESLWERTVHRYASWQICHPETPNLPSFVAKKVYYSASHHFMRCQVGAGVFGIFLPRECVLYLVGDFLYDLWCFLFALHFLCQVGAGVFSIFLFHECVLYLVGHCL